MGIIALVSAPRRSFGWLHVAGGVFAVVVAARILLKFKYFYFFSDDFLHLTLYRDLGMGRAYLARDVFGQFIPLYRLFVAIYFEIFGIRFWPYAVATVLATLIMLWILYKQARMQAVHLAIAIPVLAMAAFSPVFVDPYQWACVALSLMPACILGNAALFFSQQREGRWPLSWQMLVLLFYSIALLFYPKVLFLLVLVFTVRLFERVDSGAATTLAKSALASLFDVGPLLAVALCYGLFVSHYHYSSNAPEPTVGQLSEYLRFAWWRGFLNETLGLDRPYFAAHPISVIGFVGIVITLTIWRVKTAILWSGFLVYFLFAMGIVGMNRRVLFGLDNALTGHYYCDILVYGLVFLLLACKRTQTSSEVKDWRKFIPQASLAVTVLMSVHLIRAGERYPRTWWTDYGNIYDYVENFQRSLGEVGSTDVIADGYIPNFVMPEWMAPYTKLSKFALLFGNADKIGKSSDVGRHLDNRGLLIRR